MHVRHGDTMLMGVNSDEQAYRSLDVYVGQLGEVNSEEDVLLVTDDANVINDTSRFPAVHWLWIDRPRYRGDEGGYQSHFPSGDPAFETIVILAIRQLARRCRRWIGTPSSFGKWMWTDGHPHATRPLEPPAREQDYGAHHYFTGELVMVPKQEKWREEL
jgi:hypothetical protein